VTTRSPGLGARRALPRLELPVGPRLAAGVAAALVAQVALAVAVADERWSLAIGAGAVAVLALVATIEPRVTFCASLFYVLLVVLETSRVTVADLIIVLPLLVVVCSALAGGEIAARVPALWRATPFKVALALFVILVLIAVGKGFSSVGETGSIQSLRLALAPALLLSVAVFRDRQDLLRGLRLTFYAFIVYQFGEALFNLGTGRSATAASAVSTGGTRYVSNSAAMFLAIGLILAGLHLAREDRLLRRIGLTALMSMALVGVFLGLARSTWLALAAVTVVALLFTPEARRGAIRFLALATPIIVLVALVAPIAAPDQVRDVTQRVSRPQGQGRDESAVFREQAWGLMIDRWEESRIFGRGFGQTVTFERNDKTVIEVTNDPHNGFIYLLVGMGVVGLAAFAAIQLGFLRAAFKSLKLPGARDLALWALAAWVIYIVNVFFGVLLGQQALMMFLWYLLAVPIALLALPERAEPRPAPSRP
jgi:O-antigen ligase